ncbi:MAG: hypothetical protein E3J72_15040 [Planctomycetota bacterium]|nr:MAG: hypothetical protein E3J72_15040 [Planctomycetota bacterium]
MLGFEKPGKHNTDAVVETVLKRAAELGKPSIVVASNTGDTALKFAGKGFPVVCVTHVTGFKEPGDDEMGPERRTHLAEKGVKVFTGTHLFGGIGRACRLKHGGVYPDEIVADTLRTFGQGIKVCVEVAVMALDAGLVPYGEPVISIGGTGRGADAAVVVEPSHAKEFFKTKVLEVLCKPKKF